MDSYDALPYDTRPSRFTHPDRAFALARLHGLDPGPVQTARVLELGCGTGLNLVPMAAALPDARFVGLDRSAVQIAMGRSRAVSLPHLELRVADLRDAPAGPFDLIIAHGVYSWVPADVRDALMGVIRSRLAPTGVAFVSWNALPGWRVRGTLRDVLRHHLRAVHDPHARVHGARQLLAHLVAAEPTDPFARLVQQRAEALGEATDTYLLHDYLADDNEPVYVDAFRDHARHHGLAMLCEAELGADGAPDGAEGLMEVLGDPALASDLLAGRAFHRTLLCHEGHGGPFDPRALGDLLLRSGVEPMGEEEGEALFGRDGEVLFSTRDPALAATLRRLWAVAPGAALCREVAEPAGLPLLARCAQLGFVEVLARAPALTHRLGALPEAWGPARAAAAAGSPWVPSLLHQAVGVDALDRALLVALDGATDQAALVAKLGDAPVSAIPARLAALVRAGLFVG